jgi:NADH:ubiquinone reductase (H+-translocating)
MNQLKQNSSLFPPTKRKRVVVVGGGFGGITLVKKLRNKGYRVVMIDRNNYHTFQPLLYQVATGGLEPDSIAFPLRKIFRGYKDFFFRMAELEKIIPEKKFIETSIGIVEYDYLVLAIGSTSNYFGMDQLAANAMPLKTLPEALDLRSLILQNMEASLIPGTNREKYLNIVVAGGGPTGVETAGALCELKRHVLPHDYPELDFENARIILVEAGERLLAGMSEHASDRALKSLLKLGAEVRLKCGVSDYDGEKVMLTDGTSIPCYSFVWSAGVQGVRIDGVDRSVIGRGNRIMVDRFNRIQGSDSIFVIGDLALMKEDQYPNGHPMVAQVAIQQAKTLANNLTAIEKGTTLTPFKYKDLGSMATIGRNRAVADFPFIRLRGFLAWFLWMAVHLMTLVGFRNRVVVFINWLWNYFSYDRAIRLIIRPFRRK